MLVVTGQSRAIFVSTDLNLDPVRIIECYAMRFSIECTFRELKQQIGAFSYHFWTKSLPKLNRFKKRSKADNMSAIVKEEDRNRISLTMKATERFVMFSCIAIGLAQLIALDERFAKILSKDRYLRTAARTKQSEGTVLSYLHKNLFRLLLSKQDSELTELILGLLEQDSDQPFSEKAA
ncbi:MAG: hypothetical protein Q4E53_07000 [Eubacteriales bacterium]|nr:hypothetical protein [Eubacteriales bacterium]